MHSSKSPSPGQPMQPVAPTPQSPGSHPAAAIVLGERHEGWVVAAMGFDLYLALEHPLHHEDEVFLNIRHEHTGESCWLVGRVHWVGNHDGSPVAGISTRTAIPESLQVTIPNCQRTGLRFPCNVEGTLTWVGCSGNPLPVTAVNYSRSGACFESPVPPPIGRAFCFSWSQHGEHRLIAGRIDWVIGRGAGFLAGSELTGCSGYELAAMAFPKVRVAGSPAGTSSATASSAASCTASVS